ncbi:MULTISPECIES: TusE/DsrC/DsvC family sulfur relay protein [Cysteiniphilum]|uniref:TusE/DsrC/DsvC family sulfur relay protein n=1 Tax=Cysteiniphilum TaxID=2056696 RepID=UPI00177D52B4|nr:MULTISPECIES: TusE/DsrC/DsvC family sulfur relay protein [Cysteiniphilum]
MTQFTILLDEYGFLKDHTQWSADIADAFAKEENITLTNAHWQVINFLREYYEIHTTAPAIRLLVKSLKEKYGHEIGNSLYLQTLFPISPARQAAKIAGLPKPKRCI